VDQPLYRPLPPIIIRYVGVTSGGMDQAISVMGQPGVAKLVEFNPVRAENVHLPAGANFVIANSLTVSKKQETADRR
jgi:N-acetylgalactosamine kinase